MSQDWRVTNLETQLAQLSNKVDQLENNQRSNYFDASMLDSTVSYIDPNGMFMMNLAQALGDRVNMGYDDLNISQTIQNYINTPFEGRMENMRREISNFKLE